jgi:hypothetical protein
MGYDLVIERLGDGTQYGYQIDWHSERPFDIQTERKEVQGAGPSGDFSARDVPPPYPVHYSDWRGGADQEDGDSVGASDSSAYAAAKNRYKDSYNIDVRNGKLRLGPAMIPLIDCSEAVSDSYQPLSTGTTWPTANWYRSSDTQCTVSSGVFKVVGNAGHNYIQSVFALPVIANMKYTAAVTMEIVARSSGTAGLYLYWFKADGTASATASSTIYSEAGSEASSRKSVTVTAPADSATVKIRAAWTGESDDASQYILFSACSFHAEGFLNIAREFKENVYIGATPNTTAPRDSVYALVKGTVTQDGSLPMTWNLKDPTTGDWVSSTLDLTYDGTGSDDVLWFTAHSSERTKQDLYGEYIYIPTAPSNTGEMLRIIDYRYNLLDGYGNYELQIQCKRIPSMPITAPYTVNQTPTDYADDAHVTFYISTYHTTLSVLSATDMVPGVFLRDRDNHEVCVVTGVTGADLTVRRKQCGTRYASHASGQVWEYYKFVPVGFATTGPSMSPTCMWDDGYSLFVAFATVGAATADGSLWATTSYLSSLAALGTNTGIVGGGFMAGVHYIIRDSASGTAGFWQAGYMDASWAFQNISGQIVTLLQASGSYLGSAVIGMYFYFAFNSGQQTRVYRIQKASAAIIESVAVFEHGFIGTCVCAHNDVLYVGGYYDTGHYYAADRTVKRYLGAVQAIVGDTKALLTMIGRDSETAVIDNRVGSIVPFGPYLYITTRDDVFVWDLKNAGWFHIMDFPTGSVASVFVDYVLGHIGWTPEWQDTSLYLAPSTDPDVAGGFTKYGSTTDFFENGRRNLISSTSTHGLFAKANSDYADGVTANFGIPQTWYRSYPVDTYPRSQAGMMAVSVGAELFPAAIYQPVLSNGTVAQNYLVLTPQYNSQVGAYWKEHVWVGGSSPHNITLNVYQDSSNGLFYGFLYIDGTNYGIIEPVSTQLLDAAYSQAAGTFNNSLMFGSGWPILRDEPYVPKIGHLPGYATDPDYENISFDSITVADGHWYQHEEFGLVPAGSVWSTYDVRDTVIFDSDLVVPVPGKTLILGLAKSNAGYGWIETSNTTLKLGAVKKTFTSVDLRHTELQDDQALKVIAIIDGTPYDCGTVTRDTQGSGKKIRTSNFPIVEGGVKGTTISVRVEFYDDDQNRDRSQILEVSGITFRWQSSQQSRIWITTLDLSGVAELQNGDEIDIEAKDAKDYILDIDADGAMAQFSFEDCEPFIGTLDQVKYSHLQSDGDHPGRGIATLIIREAIE